MFGLKDKVNGMEIRLKNLEKEVHDIHASLLFGRKPEPMFPEHVPQIDIVSTRDALGQAVINIKANNMGVLTWKKFSEELNELVNKYSE